MGSWFWLNIPLALLFFGLWTGIPLWLTLTRWNAEINAKHAAIAAQATSAPGFAEAALAGETGGQLVPELSAN
jgi:hypothetical protein